MTREQIQAIETLGKRTREWFDVLDLCGRQHVHLRQDLMLLLTGNRPVQSKAGVNALRDAFFDIVKPEGNCYAAQKENFPHVWELSPLCR